jgi:hypothetical protein
MEEKKYCLKCGHEFVRGESNYNYGLRRFGSCAYVVEEKWLNND